MADPAFRGFVESTLDALLIFEGCQRGLLPKITRRLQEFEKKALVASGAVFVFDENATGIKRWTDGLSWSPSRTLGNFLVYRELDKKAPVEVAGEDSQGAASASGGAEGPNTPPPYHDDEPSALPPSNYSSDVQPIASTSSAQSQSQRGDPPFSSRRRSVSDTTGVGPMERSRERALVGSLTSSYRFRSDGLVKKTISLSGLHMIGYYKIDDVTSGRLRTPSSHSELVVLDISATFLLPSLFRVPPLVETGQDGQLKYKGEPDPSMSPATRSGSSQGFGTPVLGSSRSRPASSDSLSGHPTSPRLPPLSISSSSSQREPPPPGSPHRGSIRSSNRFEPYVNRPPSQGGQYGGSTFAFPQSPNRTTFAFPEDPYPHEVQQQPPISPSTPIPALSSAAPIWGARLPPRAQSPPNASSFYQPRHSTPFIPTEPNASSSAVFAYQPSPPQLSVPQSPHSSSARVISPTNYLPQLQQQQQQQQQPPPPRPSSSQHQHYPSDGQSYSQHSPMYPSPHQLSNSPRLHSPEVASIPSAPLQQHASTPSYERRLPSTYFERSSSSQGLHVPPSTHATSSHNTYYQVLSEPSYPSNYPAPTERSFDPYNHHHQHQQQQQHQQQRQQRSMPSGMVMAFGQDDDTRGLGIEQEQIPGHLQQRPTSSQDARSFRRFNDQDLRPVKREVEEHEWWPGEQGTWPPASKPHQ